MDSINYVHENGRNYMVINADKHDENENFQMKMLSKNNLRGLLKMESRTINGKKKYYYDISAKQQMSKNYDYGYVKWEDVKLLCSSISRTVKILRDYMLDIDCLILKPECIYMDVGREQLYLTYFPGDNQDFCTMLRNLFEYILEHFDHDTDRNTLLSMYEIYQKIIQNDYDITKLEQLADIKVENNTYEIETDAQKLPVIKIDDELEKAVIEIEKKELKSKGMFKIIRIISGITAAISVICFVLGNAINLNKYVCAAAFLISITALYESIKKIGVGEEKTDICKIPETEVKADKVEIAVEMDSADNVEEVMGQTEDLEETICRISRKIKIIDEDNKEYIIDVFPYIIGRINDMCSLAINSSAVSRMHARITLDEKGFFIEDLNSKNGTMVNGEKISVNDKKILNDSDVISIASSCFTVVIT